MELLGGGNKLIESFGRVRNSTKQLRFALGALPADNRRNDWIDDTKIVNGYHTDLRDPPVKAAAAAEGGGARNASRLQEETRSNVHTWARSLFFNRDSPFFEGGLMYHMELIKQFAGHKEAAHQSIITDTAHGEYPESAEMLVAGGNWDIPLHNRATRSMKIERGAYPPIDGQCPTTAQHVQRLNRGGVGSSSSSAPGNALATAATSIAASAARIADERSNQQLTPAADQQRLTLGVTPAAAAPPTAQDSDNTKAIKVISVHLKKLYGRKTDQLAAGFTAGDQCIKDLNADIERYASKVRELENAKVEQYLG
ncbi:hypothetical protein B484DRAFT_458964 [Ochromonadaceae sp. CCMP2298]|nr:hypothetical protein B484DRAFT_458964 [Ochromonadaceae sp. CCMP2298]